MQVLKLRNAWDALGEIGGNVAGVMASRRAQRGAAKEEQQMLARSNTGQLKNQVDALNAYKNYTGDDPGMLSQLNARLGSVGLSGIDRDNIDSYVNQYQGAYDHSNAYAKAMEGKKLKDYTFYDDYMNNAGYGGGFLGGMGGAPTDHKTPTPSLTSDDMGGGMLGSQAEPQAQSPMTAAGFIQQNINDNSYATLKGYGGWGGRLF